MNPHFRFLVREARRLGCHIIDRCNLTILEAPGYRDLPEFLADHQVETVASLPCYLAENADAQRGSGVFDQSIAALRRLNALGYGQYMQKLISAFNPAAALGVMCRTTLSVAWDGRLHACDFNQLLDIGVDQGLPRHIDQFDRKKLARRRILTGQHCFGCTAGAGSSCHGAIDAAANVEHSISSVEH